MLVGETACARSGTVEPNWFVVATVGMTRQKMIGLVTLSAFAPVPPATPSAPKLNVLIDTASATRSAGMAVTPDWAGDGGGA